jgi:hypothetical protein
MTTKSRCWKFCCGLSRRTVLIGGAAIAAAGLPMASVQDGGRAEAAVLAVVRHREAAIALGRTALSSWPYLRDRGQILANLLDDLRLDSDSAASTSASEIADRLSVRIRDDFAIARTVMLDGWVLSLAETRLYALAALVAE